MAVAAPVRLCTQCRGASQTRLGSTWARGCGIAPAPRCPCRRGVLSAAHWRARAGAAARRTHQISNLTVVSFTVTVCVRKAAPMVDSCRVAKGNQRAPRVATAAAARLRDSPGSRRTGPSRTAGRGWTCRRPCRRAAPLQRRARVSALARPLPCTRRTATRRRLQRAVASTRARCRTAPPSLRSDADRSSAARAAGA